MTLGPALYLPGLVPSRETLILFPRNTSPFQQAQAFAPLCLRPGPCRMQDSKKGQLCRAFDASDLSDMQHCLLQGLACACGFVCGALSPQQALALESGFGLFSEYVLHRSGSFISPISPVLPGSVTPGEERARHRKPALEGP